MIYKVVADRDTCIGAGQCLVADNVFSVDDEGKVVVYGDGVVAEQDLAAVKDAVTTCPTEALTLVEIE